MSDRGRTLLRLGALAGPLYITVGALQVLTREGFDMRRHALSQMANGEWGWVQVANFIVSGLLVGAGALGVRETLRGTRGGTWGPILLLGYTIGLIGAGIFRADPGAGFPPGSPVVTAMSRAGMLHFAFGGIGFYAIIAACFVFARRFFGANLRGWGIYSVLTGLGFLVSFAAIASGNQSPQVILGFYAAVAWLWVWLSLVLLKLR